MKKKVAVLLAMAMVDFSKLTNRYGVDIVSVVQ